MRTTRFMATLAMTAGALGVLTIQPAGAAQQGLHATSITAGANHGCAVNDGAVFCWGRNDHGQLGNGGGANTWSAVRVTGLTSDVTSVSAGHSHTCALTTAGTVWCWGGNLSGQLGNGSDVDSAVPVQVQDLSGVVAISSGGYHTCALTNAGAVKCWGQGRAGALGDGKSHSSGTPVSPVGLDSGVTAISAGTFHTCAILTDGSAKCWGLNANGQLGNGSTGLEPRPVDVTGIGTVVAISAGAQHTCAIDGNGAALCWGRNSAGQVGDATIDDKHSPTPVQGLASGVTEITAGTFHSCAKTADGVLCWGSDLLGQFGNGANSNVAAPIAGPVKGLAGDAHSVTAGYLHTCAITGQDEVQCWGRNNFGQLGNGSAADSNTPTAVTG